MSPRWRALRRSRRSPWRPTRRRFLAGLVGVGIGAGLSGWLTRLQEGGLAPPVPERLLEFTGRTSGGFSPALADQRPATYLLQEAGERVFAAILARLDPAAGYRPYFALDLGGAEPRLRHDVWDWIDMTGRGVDALARLRLLTGLAHGQEEEAALRALLLGQQGTDGLLWNGPSPVNGGYASEAVEIFSQSRGRRGIPSG